MRKLSPVFAAVSFRKWVAILVAYMMLVTPLAPAAVQQKAKPPKTSTVTPTTGDATPARPTRVTQPVPVPPESLPRGGGLPLGPSAPVTATLTDNISNTTKVDKGSTITYTAQITNATAGAINGVEFQDTPDANTTLVNGSVTASPVAFDDSYSATGNIPISVPAASGVLANDYKGLNPLGTVTASDTSSAQCSGCNNVSVSSDGSFTYTPPGAFTGTDTFHYTVSNSTGSSQGTVTITVSDRILFVSSSGSGSSCTSGTPCTLSTADGKSASSGKDLVYVLSGTYNTAAIGLNSNQSIVGQSVSFSQALTDVGITLATNSVSPSISANTKPVLNNTATIITLGGNNLVEQLSLNPSGGSAILGNNVTSSTVTVNSITVSATSGAGGVSLTGTNTGSIFNFNNVAVTAASGTAFNATGGGTVNATQDNSTTFNTLSSSGGKALNVSNTTIGASGLTFHSISASGGANGIFLDTTGTSGGLSVTGASGSTAKDNTGGTIQSMTGTNGTSDGHGIYLNATKNVSLKHMNIQGNQGDGVHGNSVDGFTLQYSNVGTSSGNGNTTAQLGNFSGEGDVQFVDLTTSALIDNNAFSNAFHNTFAVFDNNATSMNRIVITNNTFGTQNAANGNDACTLQATNGTFNATFSNNTVTWANGDAFQLDMHGGLTADLIMASNQLNNTAGANITPGGGGVTISSGGASDHVTFTFNINNNTITGAAGAGLGVSTGSTGVAGKFQNFSGSITNNTIGNTGVTDSGSATGSDLGVIDSGSQFVVSITGNHLSQYNPATNGALAFTVEDDAGNVANFVGTVTGNVISNPGSNASNVMQGIAFEAGAASADVSKACFTMYGNTLTGSGKNGGSELRARQRFGAHVGLLGNGSNYSGGANDTTAVVNFLTSQNTVTNSAAVSATTNAPGGFQGTCPLMLALGGVMPYDHLLFPTLLNPGQFTSLADLASAPVIRAAAPRARAFEMADDAAVAKAENVSYSVSQEQLDATVSAALLRWAAAGLTKRQLAALRSVRFEIGDLSGSYLGEAEGDRIIVDRDACGHGWFVEADPSSDDAFAHAASATRLYTDSWGAPAGRVDLLTAIEHEMGHRLGLNDTYSPGDRDSLMYGYLTVGERRLPFKGQASGARPSPLAGARFLSMPPQAKGATQRPAPTVNIGQREPPAPPTGNVTPSSPSASADVVVGGLPQGKAVTIKFSVTVNTTLSPTTAPSVSTQGSVLVTGFSATPTDDPDTAAAGDATVTLIAHNDLALTSVTDNVTSATPGSTLTYVISYSNPGRQAPSVVITETVPTGTTFNSGSSSANWNCSPNGNAGSICTNNVGTLAAGASTATINFAVTVNSPAAAGLNQIQDTANIASTDSAYNAYESDINPADNSASDTDTLNAAPAFGTFTVSDGVASTTPGSTLTYTVTYANTGNQDATGVVLTETVPTGTTYASAGSSAWSCADNSPANTACTISVGNLSGGGAGSGSATFKVAVINPAAPGLNNVVNNASITDDGNNSASAVTASAQDTDTLAAAPDLSISKSPDVSSVTLGQIITYTINYSNVGNQNATGVKVTETVSANTTFVASGSSSWVGCSDGAAAGTACTNTVGALSGGGGNGTITFKVKVNNTVPNGTTQITNVATIDDDHANGADPNTGNNTTGNVNTPLAAAMPAIKALDAKAPEPQSGTSTMLFTVSLSAAASQTVTVNYATADGGSVPATGGGSCGAGIDYVTASATLTFAAGEQVKTVPVTACAGSAGGDKTLLLNLSNPTNATISGSQAIGTITSENPPGTFIISELRTSGPGGAGDDFVELYNNTDSPLTVAASDASAGYGLFKQGADCNATPVLIATIPNGTVIPARGHYLVVGSQYSLANYGGTGAAAGDQTMTADIENDKNVSVFSTSNVANISTANRFDAAGFGANTGGVCDLMREGNTLPPVSGSTVEYSFFRKECDFVGGVGCQTPGNPKDTNDNSADFKFADTQGTFISGVPQQLGAPGPENKTSPIRRDSTIAVTLLDNTASASLPPNRVRDLTSNPGNNSTFGTLSIRRRIVNNTGGNVTRLRFRIVEVTTFPSPGGGVADVRAITSADVVGVSVSDPATCSPSPAPCSVTVKGTTLETPPNQQNGGGFNSTLSVGSVTLGTPLANGASVDVQFLLGVQTTGSFRFLIITEALP